MLDVETLPKDRQKWDEFYANLSPAEREELKRYVDREDPYAAPWEGPQMNAYRSPATVIGYGGAAYGGKSALICMLVLNEHHRSVIFRADGNDCSGLIDNVQRFYGTKTGRNNQDRVYHFADREGHLLHWGGLLKPKAEEGWRGIEHDGVFYDEVDQLPYRKVKYVQQWCRSHDPSKYRRRIIMTFNPPGGIDGMDQTGMWVLEAFGPWVNENHPNEAKFGEIRYFIGAENALDADEEVECENGEPFEIEREDGFKATIAPEPRTFFQARATDNPYADEHYLTTLYNQPKQVRERFLFGSFSSGLIDQPNQLIPAAWVDAAQARWTEEGRQQRQDSVGVDCAQGGNAFSTSVNRHGWWWDRIQRKPGKECATGGDVAVWVIGNNRNSALACVDANGIGSSTWEALTNRRQQAVAIKGQEKKIPLMRKLQRIEPHLEFRNIRCALHWWLRKILNPETGLAPALPPDKRLRRQLIAPVWWVDASGLLIVETKEEVTDKIGYSPDDSDAVVYSLANAFETEGWELLLPTSSRPNKPIPYSPKEQRRIAAASYVKQHGGLGGFPLRSSSWMGK